jgi:hypothetical protein
MPGEQPLPDRQGQRQPRRALARADDERDAVVMQAARRLRRVFDRLPGFAVAARDRD